MWVFPILRKIILFIIFSLENARLFSVVFNRQNCKKLLKKRKTDKNSRLHWISKYLAAILDESVLQEVFIKVNQVLQNYLPASPSFVPRAKRRCSESTQVIIARHNNTTLLSSVSVVNCERTLDALELELWTNCRQLWGFWKPNPGSLQEQ